MAIYPAVYRDVHGEEHTVIENDGQTLRMVVRGVELATDDPDSFSPMGTPPVTLLARLPMSFSYLCSYVLEFDVIVSVVTDDQIAEGMLHLRYDMGGPRVDGSIDRGLGREDITASLTYNNLIFTTSRNHDYLENAIAEVQAALPDGAFLKVCLNCVFGLESDMGCGGFASLGCFRDVKEEARQVRNIFDVYPLWERRTEFVQGIYVCPQFERRTRARP